MRRGGDSAWRRRLLPGVVVTLLLVGQSAAAPISHSSPTVRAQALLDARAQAVLTTDEELFTSTLGDDPEMRARQLAWFRGVAQLPWAQFEYEVHDVQWSVDRDRAWDEDVHVPRVVQRSRLRDFEDSSVERVVGFAIDADARWGESRIVSDRGPGGEPLFAGPPSPWDLAPVVATQEDAAVLVVADRGTEQDAARVSRLGLMASKAVRSALPFGWSGELVICVVSERSVLDSYTAVPGGSVDEVGAMTHPVYARVGGPEVAAVRVLLPAASLSLPDAELSWLLRHEAVHVAMGGRGRGAPTWLVEGLAEHVAAGYRPGYAVTPEDVTPAPPGMPVSSRFATGEDVWHYGLSHVAVELVADQYGEDAPWELVEVFERQPVGGRDAGQDAVLRQVLGYDSVELAARAVSRIRELYG